MKTFTAQPTATVRAAVLAASIIATTLCLGGVAIAFTWDVPEHAALAQTTPPVHV